MAPLPFIPSQTELVLMGIGFLTGSYGFEVLFLKEKGLVFRLNRSYCVNGIIDKTRSDKSPIPGQIGSTSRPIPVFEIMIGEAPLMKEK